MPLFKKRPPAWHRFLKKYRAPLALTIILILLVIFWGNISWLFNGNVWRQILADYFPQVFPQPYVLVKHSPELKSTPVNNQNETNNPNSLNANANSTPFITNNQDNPRRDLLSIPKLGLIAPIVTAATNDPEVVHSLLDSGVVLYPGSAPFGGVGQTVVLGHSAPPGWPKIKYDWVFSRINELQSGDLIVITYNNETRYYSVVSSRVVDKQEGLPQTTIPGNSLALVSCWPPGKDLNRIVVEATLAPE